MPQASPLTPSRHTPAGPLRVGLVSRSLMMGGAQQHLVKLCQHCPRDQVQLSLFLHINNEKDDLRASLPENIAVFTSPYARSNPLTTHWLASQLREQRIQLIHSFLWTADALCSFAKLQLPRIPFIFSERGDRGDRSYYNKKRNLFDRLFTFHTSSQACANSQFGRTLLARHGFPASQTAVIPNGVDLEKIDAVQPVGLRQQLGLAPDAPIVGAVIRLETYKGIEDILQAALLLKNSSAHFVILGDGSRRAELEAAVRSLQLEGRFFLLGTRQPAASYIKDFDIGVLPSREDTEHCSNSILEYMACRKPVVATRVGGNPELVSDGVSGTLIERGRPHELAAEIAKLLENPAYAQQAGRAGRQKVEQSYQIQPIAGQFVQLWQQIGSPA